MTCHVLVLLRNIWWCRGHTSRHTQCWPEGRTGPVNLPPACECSASDSDTKPPLQCTDSDDPAPEPGRSLEEESDSTVSLYASFDPGGITRTAAVAPGFIRHRRSMVGTGNWFKSHRPHPSASQLCRRSHRTSRRRLERWGIKRRTCAARTISSECRDFPVSDQ
jgi:hypothetical protein